MSEITKLYENCGIEIPTARLEIFKDDNGEIFTRPPFSIEKQLELIKFLMKQEDFSWTIAQQGKDTEYVFYVGYEYGSGCFKEFTEALAGIINNLWQDLSDAEKAQIKEILNVF